MGTAGEGSVIWSSSSESIVDGGNAGSLNIRITFNINITA